MTKLFFNEINKFLMVFQASNSDKHSAWVDVFELESLEDMSVEVVDVVSVSSQWHTESLATISDLHDLVVEIFSSVEVVLELVSFVIFPDTDLSCYY